MADDTQYLRKRHGLNPHRDSRPPYQSEMVQWNDGYDKGYQSMRDEAKVLLESQRKMWHEDLELAKKKIEALEEKKTIAIQAMMEVKNNGAKTTDEKWDVINAALIQIRDR